MLVHAHPGALQPAGIGVGEHHHVDRLAGHVRDHRLSSRTRSLRWAGVHTWGRPKSKPRRRRPRGPRPARPRPRSASSRTRWRRSARAGASGPRTRLRRRGLGADLDHVDLLAGGDGGQGVGAGLAVGAVGRPQPRPGDHRRPACLQPGVEVVGVAEPGPGGPAGAAGAAHEHRFEAEDRPGLAVPDPRGRPG